jgi:hypothetical protein
MQNGDGPLVSLPLRIIHLFHSQIDALTGLFTRGLGWTTKGRDVTKIHRLGNRRAPAARGHKRK